MASVVPMSFFTPDETINPNEYTFEIADAAARSKAANKVLRWSSCEITNTNGASGTLATITDSRITANHFLDKFTISDVANPVVVGPVSYAITDGQAVLTGISVRSSTAEITLVKEDS